MCPYQPKNRDAQLHPQFCLCLSPKSMLFTNILRLLDPLYNQTSFLERKKESEVTQSCPTLFNPMECSLPNSSIHGIFLGKSTGVGCHFFLQGILPTQWSNPGLLHYRQTLYCLSHNYFFVFPKYLLTCPIAVVKFHPTAKCEGRVYIRLPSLYL